MCVGVLTFSHINPIFCFVIQTSLIHHFPRVFQWISMFSLHKRVVCEYHNMRVRHARKKPFVKSYHEQIPVLFACTFMCVWVKWKMCNTRVNLIRWIFHGNFDIISSAILSLNCILHDEGTKSLSLCVKIYDLHSCEYLCLVLSHSHSHWCNNNTMCIELYTSDSHILLGSNFWWHRVKSVNSYLYLFGEIDFEALKSAKAMLQWRHLLAKTRKTKPLQNECIYFRWKYYGCVYCDYWNTSISWLLKHNYLHHLT